MNLAEQKRVEFKLFYKYLTLSNFNEVKLGSVNLEQF